MCGSDFDGLEKNYKVINPETKEVLGTPSGFLLEQRRDGEIGEVFGASYSKYAGAWYRSYDGDINSVQVSIVEV